MGGPRISLEKTRFFSIVAVVALAGGLFAFLFHDTTTVDVRMTGPSFANEGDLLVYEAEIIIPAGQRMPLAAVSFVVQDPSTNPPTVLDVGTCWRARACGASVVHGGPRFYAGLKVDALEPVGDTTSGPLSVWVKGYGNSPATGYGAEVETQRRLVATDIVDEAGRQAYGSGFEGQTLRYLVEIPASDLGPGDYSLAFLADSGSRAMGTISGASFSLRILPSV